MPKDSSLVAKYQELSLFEKSLLQLLSIFYEPVHASLVVNCLRRLQFKNPRGNRPTAITINHYFNKFEKLGLLNQERQCVTEVVEVLSKYAVAEGSFARYASAVRHEAPISYYHGKWSTRCWRAMRDLRIGIYTEDFELIDGATAFIESQCKKINTALPIMMQVCARPFDENWLDSLPASFRFYLLNNVLEYCRNALVACSEIVAYLEKQCSSPQISNDENLPFHRLLFTQLLIEGELDRAKRLVNQFQESFQGTGALGTIFFLENDQLQAAQTYQEDLDFLRELSGTDKVAFFGPTGLFYILFMLKEYGESGHVTIAERIAVASTLFESAPENASYQCLAAVLDNINGAGHIFDFVAPTATGLELVLAALCQYWLHNTLDPEMRIQLEESFVKAQENNYFLLAAFFAEILEKIDQAPLEIMRQKVASDFPQLLPLLQPKEPWKRSLEALIHATTLEKNGEEPNTTRLIWLMNLKKDPIAITPKEQKRRNDGNWSKGRPIALGRLYENKRLPFLTAQDRKICNAIRKITSKTSQGEQYQLEVERALVAMVGHPLLFLANSPETPVELSSGEPELLVEERGDTFHIRFAQPLSPQNITIHKETPNRIKLIRIDENHRRIAQITGRDGLTVPKEASEQVLTAIGNISSFMTVHSAIASDHSGSGDIEFVDADSTIYMHLSPYSTGFRLEMFVKPFREGGHYLKPGQGVENIMAEVNGRRLQTRRDLGLEEKKARDIEELCPIFDLAMDLEQEKEREWHLQDPDDCLQALLELQAIRDKVVVEWPEGEKLRISHQASMENLNLKIRTNRHNWFALSGQLELDQDHVLELRELLAKARMATGRFIEIGDGQFVALTQEFKKRLEDVLVYSEGAEGEDEVLIHSLAALPLEKLTNNAKTTGDREWHEHLARLNTLEDFQPELPSTLQAELRDYQRQGYDWLARLAHWGVGGCLADDMGLGKTLQSLAILLKNAADGPSLVVAPTSVSNNWLSEVIKFTPTLTSKTLAVKDRKAVIEGLGSFDLLITTYTLLQQEEALLKEVSWQTVILDEAQAIKNAATKRSRAAMALRAKFRLITTGTPIENHLGELWNLFHFINPGLLGSLNSFNDRFAIPIERHQNREARFKLKKLIRPFILRRIKSQVLEELPSRTEVTLEVSMSPEERVFYEALRQNALELFENNTEKKGRHIQILAEIMKLRQACCNPRLLDVNSPIQSAKLEVFSSLVKELIASHHKVLVFSQFIGHLQIIREFFDQEHIHYQYLDGKTPSALRKKRVEAFQNGEGDVFLISLKAGGLGLNLTAADYVIHMDPWWNPAIEDQASDRAHRIGQTRPVTIYRLVCKNTIEEQIVRLHQEKRDLAGTLLEGSDMSARMSSEELLDLIRKE